MFCFYFTTVFGAAIYWHTPSMQMSYSGKLPQGLSKPVTFLKKKYEKTAPMKR